MLSITSPYFIHMVDLIRYWSEYLHPLLGTLISGATCRTRTHLSLPVQFPSAPEEHVRFGHSLLEDTLHGAEKPNTALHNPVRLDLALILNYYFHEVHEPVLKPTPNEITLMR